jgi:hypothetical protein
MAAEWESTHKVITSNGVSNCESDDGSYFSDTDQLDDGEGNFCGDSEGNDEGNDN